MRLTFLILFFITVVPFFSFGQGCITILSDDGDKFYLSLNGERQNTEPQTGVRVDGLMDKEYNASIVFSAPDRPELIQKIPIKDAATGKYMEMTYKIERT